MKPDVLFVPDRLLGPPRRDRLRFRPFLLAAMLAGAAALPSCGADRGVGPEAPVSARSSELLSIRNARVPMDGVLSGGQPTPQQVEEAARAGFRTVINLRTEGESGFEWEPEAVERLGMRYVSIPVAGADGLTRENAERLDAALAAARPAGPVLLHCGSGNRIGALLALRAAWVEGVDPGEALHYGLASGLTRLEGATREALGLPTLPPAEPAETAGAAGGGGG